MNKNGEKEAKRSKGQTKANNKTTKVNKGKESDNKAPPERKGGEADDVSDKFPNFSLLNEEERQVFFQALTDARKNVEKRGLPARDRFGTVHDEYLKYFHQEPKQEVEQKPNESPSVPKSDSTTLEGSTEPSTLCVEQPKSTSPTLLLEGFSETPLTPSDIITREPEILDQCESLIQQDTEKVVNTFLKKKKKHEAKTCCKKPDQPPKKNTTEKKKKEKAWAFHVSEKSAKTKETPRFDALNAEEKQVFFDILQEARNNIVVKNPDRKSEVLPMEAILRRYKGDRPSTTIEQQKRGEPKKNLRVKVTLTSGDNDRTIRTKSEDLGEAEKDRRYDASKRPPSEDFDLLETKVSDTKETGPRETEWKETESKETEKKEAERKGTVPKKPLVEEQQDSTGKLKRQAEAQNLIRELEMNSSGSFQGKLLEEWKKTKHKEKLDAKGKRKIQKTSSYFSEVHKEEPQKKGKHIARPATVRKKKEDEKKQEEPLEVGSLEESSSEEVKPVTEEEEKEVCEGEEEERDEKEETGSFQLPEVCPEESGTLQEEETTPQDSCTVQVSSVIVKTSPEEEEEKEKEGADEGEVRECQSEENPSLTAETSASLGAGECPEGASPQEGVAREFVGMSSTAKVMIVDDNVIDKIRKLIYYLEAKAGKDGRLEKEYMKLLVDYVDYLSRVLETLVQKKERRKQKQIQRAYPAEVRMEFDDNLRRKNPKEDKLMPRSISAQVLHRESIADFVKHRMYGSEEKAPPSYSGKTPSLSMFPSDSDSSVVSENETFQPPPSSSTKKVVTTKIRLLQDLLKQRAEFVEGSMEDFKIIQHPETEYIPVEKPPMVKLITEDDEEATEKSRNVKFIRALIRCFTCGKKKEEEEGIFENLRGEAVRVDVCELGSKDAANVTLNLSTMEVLKAAGRKRIIDKYYSKT